MIIKTPIRLHMGIIDISRKFQREYGALGVMVKGGFEVKVEKDEHLSVKASEENAVDIKAAYDAMKSKLDIKDNFRIEVLKSIPRHMGLGSTTQLKLAMGAGIGKLSGHDLKIKDLADIVGRGRYSATGTYGFDKGGFILEGGKSGDEEIPPMTVHYRLPEDWRFLMVCPKIEQSYDEEEERPIMDYHYLMTKLMHQDGLDIKVERYLENKILKTNKDLVARSLNRNESKQVYKSYEKILERSSGENGRNKEVKKGLKSLYKKNYPVDSFSNLKEYINILKLYNRYYEDEGLPWWLKRNMKKIIKEYFKKEQVETELKTYIKKVYKNSAVDSAIREDLEDLLEYYEKRLKKARKDGTFNRFIG